MKKRALRAVTFLFSVLVIIHPAISLLFNYYWVQVMKKLWILETLFDGMRASQLILTVSCCNIDQDDYDVLSH